MICGLRLSIVENLLYADFRWRALRVAHHYSHQNQLDVYLEGSASSCARFCRTLRSHPRAGALAKELLALVRLRGSCNGENTEEKYQRDAKKLRLDAGNFVPSCSDFAMGVIKAKEPHGFYSDRRNPD